MQSQIEEFNEKLVENKRDITIIDYVKELNKKYFDIDISFIDDFIDLVDKEGFVIHHSMLEKYQVITIKDTYEVKRLLEKYEFEHDKDYKTTPAQLRGGTDYMLNGEIFKMILMRSKNTKRYAQYYILLEKCIKYYNDYQFLKIQNKLDIICNDRVLNLDNPEKKERFIIVFRNEALINQYAVIRTQIKHVKDILRKIGHEESDIIINIPCCYANNLYNKIKEQLKNHIIFEKKYLYINKDNGYCEEWSIDPNQMENKYNHVSITRNIGLIDISEEEFINKIYEIDKQRFEH